MDEFIGKKVFLRIKVDRNILIFTGIITSLTESRINFTDKFNEKYSYRLSDVIEIKEENDYDK